MEKDFGAYPACPGSNRAGRSAGWVLFAVFARLTHAQGVGAGGQGRGAVLVQGFRGAVQGAVHVVGVGARLTGRVPGRTGDCIGQSNCLK